MGAPISIVLQPEERKKYESLCRSAKASVRLKERLSIVLLAADGLNNGEIAKQLPVSAHMAGRWRKRFA
jgi:DNA-binding NarL/FixJ family response regulator